ncbi:MAG: threonine--tRNA ligase [Patescibacteria group bacterium]|nr:threonine--tRNA ligase [Patescibacteria group bacterium]
MENEKLHHIRHSLAHILASAVVEMFPQANLGVGPVIENGFYYDFLLPRPITPEDLKKIEKRMRELVKQKLPFERQEMSTSEAKDFFRNAKQTFKVELIEDIEKFGTTEMDQIEGQAGKPGAAEKKVESVSLYKTGKFVDLCRGGHVENTSEIKTDAFKLDRFSGAYWRGDQKNSQMQRIYGLAFETKEELDAYLKMVEEAEKRDHRSLGPKLDLFMFHEYAPGIPFYLPKGSIVRNELEKFVRAVSYGPGYSEVRLPQLFDSELFKTSGHWEHYKDDMFILESEGRTFGLKPMNCPGHMLLFKQGLYSYRDLPLRYAEMSTLYRNELSGTLSGLTRVRAFAQDDCHIFLAPEQVADEVAELLSRIQKIYAVFNMQVEDVALSTKPEKSLGTKEEWDTAEAALAEALKKAGWQYEINAGDGAFYGPKIDMRIRDALGRKWQLATIQLDFQMPQRFGLEYVAPDSSRKTPIVIHRALLGSFERFLAILIEHYAGAFPLWLSPVQVSILPISENQTAYAGEIKDKLLAVNASWRMEVDARDESIGKKIREATMQKVPYQIILGQKEADAGVLSVRTREGEDLGQMNLEAFAEKLQKQIIEKK